MNECLELHGLTQRLFDPRRNEEFTVFVREQISLMNGDFVAILGPSGCGKTTLLTVLGLLRAPTFIDDLKRFSIWVHNHNGDSTEVDLRDAWKNRKLRLIEKIRREHVGFALQSGELIPSLTVSENIAVPLHLNLWRRRAVKTRVAELVDSFGLGQRSADSSNSGNPIRENAEEQETRLIAASRIDRLSGGEYQRVVLARAIAHRPRIVYVDEPTSALNRELAKDALSLLRDLQTHSTRPGISVMITHDELLAREFCNVMIHMEPVTGQTAGEVVKVERRDLVKNVS